jgi:hypothetical protein
MTPGAFLRHVWPTTGHYCLVTVDKVNGEERRRHYVYPTIAEAVTGANELLNSHNLFLAVLSLKEPVVIHPTKISEYTKQPLRQYRITQNMLASRALIFDIDVGSDDPKKYATQGEALVALERFCLVTGMPVPTTVSSGGGVHVYWRLDRDVSAAEYVEMEARLKGVAKVLELRFDPSRTTDVTSLLRVAGSFNRKIDQLRPVKVLSIGEQHSPEMLGKHLSLLAIEHRAVVTVPDLKRTIPTGPLAGMSEQIIEGFAPETLADTMKVCEQIRVFVESHYDSTHFLHNKIDNSGWYRMGLGVVAQCVDGANIMRELTTLCPRSSADIEVKLVQAARLPPTSCAIIAETSPLGDEPCTRCAAASFCKNPIMGARLNVTKSVTLAMASETIVTPPPPPIAGAIPPPPPTGSIPVKGPPPPPPPAGTVTTSLTRPLPPIGVPNHYILTDKGIIYKISLDEDGDEHRDLVMPFNIYPIGITCLPDRTGYASEWVSLAKDNQGRFLHPENIVIPNKDLYEDREMRKIFLDRGVNIPLENWKDTMAYVSAYVQSLQKAADTNIQRDALGWADNGKVFVMPDKTYHADGRQTPSNMHLTEATKTALASGTLPAQLGALAFYFDDPDALIQQAMLLTSLGSPLVRFTGQVGFHVAIIGESGVAKSTLLNACASLWGRFDQYVINGTKAGATKNYIGNRMAVLSNLPVLIDEVTHLDPEEAATLAMRSSQAAGRGRLNPDGTEKRQIGEERSSCIMSTSNRSMFELLGNDTAARTAGHMRVIEIEMLAPKLMRGPEARLMMDQLMQNCGHVGRKFAAYVAANQVSVAKLVETIMAKIERDVEASTSERFWVAWLAVVIATAEIVRMLNLLEAQIDQIYAWAITDLIPDLRHGVEDNVAQAPEVLSAIIRRANGSTARINNRGNLEDIPQNGEVTGLVNDQTRRMFIPVTSVKNYLRQNNVSRSVLDSALKESGNLFLGESRVSIPTKAGAWVRTNCYVFDLDHRMLSTGSRPALHAVDGDQRTG